MSNDWSWWQAACENPKEIGQSHLPVSVDAPEQGFFKMRWNKQKPWLPVAIWKDEDGKWLALRAGRPVDPLEAWNYCCRHPIASEEYDKALAGEGWSDDDPTVAAALMGHNVGDRSEFEVLSDEIESAKQGAEAYADIETEEQASKAQSLRARMNELAGKADKIREELKKPHFEAGKAVDALYMPLVKSAKAVADLLRKEIETFKTAQLLELRRLELERQKLDVAVTPPELPTIDATIKGSYGRAATVKAKVVVTGIDNWDTAIAQYRGDSRLIAALMKMAQEDINAGQHPAGFVTAEQAVIS